MELGTVVPTQPLRIIHDAMDCPRDTTALTVRMRRVAPHADASAPTTDVQSATPARSQPDTGDVRGPSPLLPCLIATDHVFIATDFLDNRYGVFYRSLVSAVGVYLLVIVTRWVCVSGCVVACCLLGGQLTASFRLGLGMPPWTREKGYPSWWIAQAKTRVQL